MHLNHDTFVKEECSLNIIRREEIRQYIESKGEVSLAELQELFSDCSSMTLRRDLIRLEEEGVLKRIRGGAIALNRVVTGAEGLYSMRVLENVKAKMHIAQKAVEYIKDAHSIYMDSGSTIMYVAKVLPETFAPILTSGANIALELIKNPRATVTLLGGQLNHNTLSLSGGLAMQGIDVYNIDVAVMGSSGFTLETGFTSGTFTENELKRKVLRKARKAIMLMDRSKIGRSMPQTFAMLQDVDVLILDGKPDDAIVGACEANEVELIY